MTEQRLRDAKTQLEIQGREGNWNYDSYMFGLYNGMECIIAAMENREPAYRESPPAFLVEGPARTFTAVACEESSEV